jgi:hypothetical protein
VAPVTSTHLFFVLTAACQAYADIAFLVGDPGSIQFNSDQQAWLRDVLAFVSAVIRQFAISQSKARFGFVKFDYNAKIEFYFNTYANTSVMVPAVRAIGYNGGALHVASGLSLARSDLLNTSVNRPAAAKIAILVVDQQSNVDPTNTIHEAQRLKDAGVELYVIGVTVVIDINEMTSMASSPTDQHVYTVDDYPYLDLAANWILPRICNAGGTSTPNSYSTSSSTQSSSTTMTRSSTSSSTTRTTTSSTTIISLILSHALICIRPAVYAAEACFALFILRDSYIYVSRNLRSDARRLSRLSMLGRNCHNNVKMSEMLFWTVSSN